MSIFKYAEEKKDEKDESSNQPAPAERGDTPTYVDQEPGFHSGGIINKDNARPVINGPETIIPTKKDKDD